MGLLFGVLKPFLVRITRFRLSKGVTALLSPLSFRGSSILLTIRNTSLSQPLKCNSLTPHEAPKLAKLQEESYVGVG